MVPLGQNGTCLGSSQFINIGEIIGPISGKWLSTVYIDYMFAIISLIMPGSVFMYNRAQRLT